MDTNIEYKIVQGNWSSFQNEINDLSKEGWIPQGSLSTIQNGSVYMYVILMSK